MVCFLEWKSRDWVSKTGVRANVVTPEVCSGLSAYARKQASVFRNLATWFCRRWHSTLNSLSLSHAWATEFLKTQDMLLIDPELRSKSSTTPDHAEPPTANATTVLPTPTNPETGHVNPETNSDTGGRGGLTWWVH